MTGTRPPFSWLLTAGLLFFSTTCAADPLERKAVLVAPGNYTSLEKAPYLNRGIQELRDQLKEAGFRESEIVYLSDLSASAVLEQLDQVVDGTDGHGAPKRLLVVAVAGHGLQLKGRDYLCMSNTTSSDIQAAMNDADGTNLLAVQDIVSALAVSATKQKLLLIDSAGVRSPVSADAEFTPGPLASRRFGSQLLQQTGSIWTVASRSGRLTNADTDENVMTQFMRSVVGGLAFHGDTNHDKAVTILELSAYVNKYAIDEDSKLPELQGKVNLDTRVTRTTQEAVADPIPHAVATLLYTRMRNLASSALVVEHDLDVAAGAIEHARLFARTKKEETQLLDLELTLIAARGDIQGALSKATAAARPLMMLVPKAVTVYQPGQRAYRRTGSLPEGAIVRITTVDSTRVDFEKALVRVTEPDGILFKPASLESGLLFRSSLPSKGRAANNAVVQK